MNRETIIQMAREAGFEVHERKQQARVGIDALIGVDSTAKLERFAALIAAAEREECAKVCESTGWATSIDEWRDMTKKDVADKSMHACAYAIRARGEG